jgi:ribosomal protein S18 acetylase RimI-like enzyme
MLDRIKKRHIVLLTLLIAIMVVVIFYFRGDAEPNQAFIRPYDKERDYQALVLLINANKFWVSESNDFSPETFLELQAPGLNPKKKGLAKIDVLEFEDKTVGYVSYYMRTSENGFIWLLAVNEDYRGRGFGELLARHALKYFESRDAHDVKLYTRTINKAAVTLYKKLGFNEESRDEERGMVTLIKKLK